MHARIVESPWMSAGPEKNQTPQRRWPHRSPSHAARALVWVALDWNWQALVHADDFEPVLAVQARYLNTAILKDRELCMRSPSGQYRWFRARGAAVRSEAGLNRPA